MELIVDFPQERDGSGCHLPQETRPTVSFAEYNQVIIVDDSPLKYKTDLFYSEHDIKMFKLHTTLLVDRLKKRGPEEYMDPKYGKDTTDIMGLEKYLTEQSYQSSLHRRRVQPMAVMLEQYRQVSLGIYDPHTLASISAQASETSRTRSHIIGLLHTD